MPEPDHSLHVVFGATGAIGGAVVGELLREGRSVRAVRRAVMARPPRRWCPVVLAAVSFVIGDGLDARSFP
jgi:uncharacterized protein YbjT (DUF2867 family)